MLSGDYLDRSVEIAMVVSKCDVLHFLNIAFDCRHWRDVAFEDGRGCERRRKNKQLPRSTLPMTRVAVFLKWSL